MAILSAVQMNLKSYISYLVIRYTSTNWYWPQLFKFDVFLSNDLYLADEENSLLQGLNSYRNSLQLPPLTKNKQAGCLADELADEIKDRPCVPTVAANAIPGGSATQFLNYPKLLKKCNIDPNTTGNGIILPVCVRKLEPTLVLTNYTRTGYARYVNDSRFTGAGLGSEDDWMVVVLATSTAGGSFASNAADVVLGLLNYFMPFLVGFFFVQQVVHVHCKYEQLDAVKSITMHQQLWSVLFCVRVINWLDQAAKPSM